MSRKIFQLAIFYYVFEGKLEIDPPYYNCEDYYGKNIFNKNDFYNLAEVLSNIKGKFILSLNDVPEIREIFKQYNMKEVEVPYSVSNLPSGRKNNPELLIYNFNDEN